MTTTAVFVQGGETDEQMFPWMFFHLDPFRDPPPAPINVAFFDYPNGTLKEWRNITLVRGAPPTPAPDVQTPLTPTVQARLSGGGLDPGPPKPSVLALYDWVKSQPRASISSLQVFSHGYGGGPILWNSYEYDATGEKDPYDGSPRDAHDTDFRIRDFEGTNPLAGREGRRFRRAFVAHPFVKLWGCVYTQSARDSVRAHHRAPRGTRGDALRRSHLTAYLTHIGTSFPMVMSSALDLSVWASPEGYGSQSWSDVPIGGGRTLSVRYRGRFPPDLRRDHWWRVSWYFRNQDGGARFYTDVLRARLDPMDFVEYRRTWFDAAVRTTGSAIPVEGPAVPVTTPATLFEHVMDRVDSLFP